MCIFLFIIRSHFGSSVRSGVSASLSPSTWHSSPRQPQPRRNVPGTHQPRVRDGSRAESYADLGDLGEKYIGERNPGDLGDADLGDLGERDLCERGLVGGHLGAVGGGLVGGFGGGGLSGNRG